MVGLLNIEPDARSRHPGFRVDAPHPIGEGWNSTEILANMLLGDQSHRDFATSGIGDRGAEHGFRGEASFCMMTQCPVPEVGQDHFRCIQPIMDGLVVGSRAPE
jgi:hypothetical protein